MTESTPDYNRLEARQAKKDKAKVVKNSGRGMNKGDAILHDKYMLDYKFTEKASYSTNLAKFNALEKQAWRQRLHAITVSVHTDHGGKAIAHIEWELLKEILEELNEQQG